MKEVQNSFVSEENKNRIGNNWRSAIVARPRRGGKTTRLIEIANETFATIVCRDKQMCSYISAIAKEKGYDIPFPITYTEFKDKRYFGEMIKGFLIDDAELLLQSMSPNVQILGLSVSIEE